GRSGERKKGGLCARGGRSRHGDGRGGWGGGKERAGARSGRIWLKPFWKEGAPAGTPRTAPANTTSSPILMYRCVRGTIRIMVASRLPGAPQRAMPSGAPRRLRAVRCPGCRQPSRWRLKAVLPGHTDRQQKSSCRTPAACPGTIPARLDYDPGLGVRVGAQAAEKVIKVARIAWRDGLS